MPVHILCQDCALHEYLLLGFNCISDFFVPYNVSDDVCLTSCVHIYYRSLFMLFDTVVQVRVDHVVIDNGG